MKSCADAKIVGAFRLAKCKGVEINHPHLYLAVFDEEKILSSRGLF